MDDDLLTDPLLDLLLFDERFTVEREELLLLVLFTPELEDLLLFVIPSIAALPKARPSDLKNLDDRFWLRLAFPTLLAVELTRFLTVAFSTLLFTAD